MTDMLLSFWVRRFLLEHLVGERNLARNTQKSYRDTLQQLLPFACARHVAESTDSRLKTSRQIGCGPSCAIWKSNTAAGRLHAISGWRRSIPWLTSSVCTAQNTCIGADRSR